MIEHVTDLLGAYLDGELHNLRLRQVEDHLAKCAACRAELEELRGLSLLLQESVPAEALTPTDRFVANLTLNLPRRPDPVRSRTSFEFLWWLLPASTLVLWFLFQTAATLSTLVSAASMTGLFGNATAWLQNGSQNAAWFSASMNLFGSHINGDTRTTLDVLNGLSVFGAGYLVQLIWQAAIGLVIAGWLAAWFAYRRRQGERLPQEGLHS